VDEAVSELGSIEVEGPRREAREASTVQEGLEGREGCDEHVDAEVKLEAIEKQRIVHVALYHHVLAVAHLADVANHVDASPPRKANRLHYPKVGNAGGRRRRRGGSGLLVELVEKPRHVIHGAARGAPTGE
jgi:hypothetical protein